MHEQAAIVATRRQHRPGGVAHGVGRAGRRVRAGDDGAAFAAGTLARTDDDNRTVGDAEYVTVSESPADSATPAVHPNSYRDQHAAPAR